METGRRSEVHGQLGYIVSWGQAWLHEILSLRKSKQTKNIQNETSQTKRDKVWLKDMLYFITNYLHWIVYLEMAKIV